MSILGRDKRNNIRGACMEHPDCIEYEWKPDVGLNCIYCTCSPALHKLIELNSAIIIIEQENQGDNELENESEISGSLDANALEILLESQNSFDENAIYQSCRDPLDLPSTSNGNTIQNNKILKKRHTCIQCEQEVTLNYLIPDVFRPNLMKSINLGMLDSNEQAEIIRVIASNMIHHEKTEKDHAVEVAVALVNKIPALKGGFGSNYVGVEKALRDCVKRQKMKKNKNKCQQLSESEWQKEQRDLMEREVRKGKEQSKEILRKTLQQTRAYRSKDIKGLTAQQILQKYPALKVHRMILWEFSDSYSISASGMKQNWLEALPKILTILPPTSSVDINGQTIHVLLNLQKAFHLRNKENQKELLIIHKPGTPPEYIIPKKDEPPCFSAVGNSDDQSLNLFGYVDGIAMFNDKPVEAVLQMIAIYWIFNIKFHPTQKQSLLFICACLFRKKSSALLGKALASALSVTKLLSKAKIS